MSFLPSPNDLLLFVSAAVILLIIPGPAVLYVLTRSIDQGRKAGLASCAGIATGTLVHVLGATLGLSALLLSSAVAYSLVKYAGAAYLIYLGIKKLRERSSMDVNPKHVAPLPDICANTQAGSWPSAESTSSMTGAKRPAGASRSFPASAR